MENSANSFGKFHHIAKARVQEGCTVAFKVSTWTVSTVKTLLEEKGLQELTSLYKFSSGRKDQSVGKKNLMITARKSSTGHPCD